MARADDEGDRGPAAAPAHWTVGQAERASRWGHLPHWRLRLKLAAGLVARRLRPRSAAA